MAKKLKKNLRGSKTYRKLLEAWLDDDAKKANKMFRKLIRKELKFNVRRQRAREDERNNNL